MQNTFVSRPCNTDWNGLVSRCAHLIALRRNEASNMPRRAMSLYRSVEVYNHTPKAVQPHQLTCSLSSLLSIHALCPLFHLGHFHNMRFTSLLLAIPLIGSAFAAPAPKAYDLVDRTNTALDTVVAVFTDLRVQIVRLPAFNA